MRALKSFAYRFSVAGELLAFLWARKLWWLIPFIVLLLVFGLFIFLGQVTGVGPFIYTLF